MVERHNDFAGSEYIEEYLRNHHREESWKESLQKALEQQAEIRMDEIHQVARVMKILQAIKEAADDYRKRDLIEESNTVPLGTPYYPDLMHKMMRSRYGGDRQRLFAAEHNHQYSPKTGWGRRKDLTRKEYQVIVDRHHQRRINREFDLAEEDDRKAGIDVYR